eukprot:COSAG01_NODE_2504_length_7555_cov_3.189646_4_plen_196_part_00
MACWSEARALRPGLRGRGLRRDAIPVQRGRGGAARALRDGGSEAAARQRAAAPDRGPGCETGRCCARRCGGGRWGGRRRRRTTGHPAASSQHPASSSWCWCGADRCHGHGAGGGARAHHACKCCDRELACRARAYRGWWRRRLAYERAPERAGCSAGDEAAAAGAGGAGAHRDVGGSEAARVCGPRGGRRAPAHT